MLLLELLALCKEAYFQEMRVMMFNNCFAKKWDVLPFT